MRAGGPTETFKAALAFMNGANCGMFLYTGLTGSRDLTDTCSFYSPRNRVSNWKDLQLYAGQNY
jgi:hypothetical protein